MALKDIARGILHSLGSAYRAYLFYGLQRQKENGTHWSNLNKEGPKQDLEGVSEFQAEFAEIKLFDAVLGFRGPPNATARVITLSRDDFPSLPEFQTELGR